MTGGEMIYSTLTSADLYTTRDIEMRGPGDEYPMTPGADLQPRLAVVEDWGGKFKVPDEDIIRNNVSALDRQVTQLANTIARRLDERLMAKLEAAITGKNVVPGHDWSNLVTVGDPTTLTESASLPTADLAACQLVADLGELGVKIDCLIVHPQDAFALKVAYADKLQDMLDSAGVELVSNSRLTPGVGWAIQKGAVGTVGFERPLTVDIWDDRSVKSKFCQSYVVPAIAIDRPEAAVKPDSPHSTDHRHGRTPTDDHHV